MRADSYCPRCKENKHHTEFNKTHRWCRGCQREYRASRRSTLNEQQRAHRNRRNDNLYKYDLSPDEYERILEEQNGVCAICKLKDEEERNWLRVDHLHGTKTVRGLLCAKCNRGLGLFNDDILRIARAIGYLSASRMNELPTQKETFWLSVCDYAAKKFSTCGKSAYFSVIIDQNGYQISQGWNGPPAKFPHCIDGGCSRFLEGSPSGSSYENCVAQHAEIGAILRAPLERRSGATIIVNGMPCFECSKMIVHSGLARVVYYKNDSYDFTPSRDLMSLAKIKLVGVDR